MSRPAEKMSSETSEAGDYVGIDNGLALYLNNLLKEFVQAREPQELMFVENYDDYMRIVRDDDTKGSGAPKARKARKLFFGLTRGKIRTARSRILDSLFGQAKMPFDISESDASVRELADAFEDILVRQLVDMEYPQVLGKAVNGLCIYGTAYTCGPYTRRKTLTRVVNSALPNAYELSEEKFVYDEPYFTYDRTIDVFPDQEVTGSDTGRGVFIIRYKHAWELEEWEDDPDYHFIEEALKQKDDSWMQAHGSKLLYDSRANINFVKADKRLAVGKFFGRVPLSKLTDWPDEDTRKELPKPDDADDDPTVEINAVMVGQVVVRAHVSPWPERPVYRAFYEDGDDEVNGVGIAENNAAGRLFMEGKGLALLGMWDIDRSKFAPDEDFKMYGGKVFRRAPGVTNEEAQAAMRQIVFADVTEGWETAMDRALQFSDDDTGIPKYSQGTDARHLNKTATGVSLIMGSAAFPLKEVMQNIDKRWIDKHIASLIEWDLKYLEPEVVERLFNKEMAIKWQAIKAWGKANFIEVRPTGTSSYVAQEILLQKLTQFLNIVLQSPAAIQATDIRELLEQVWDAMQVGKESPVYDDKTLAEKQAQQQQSPEFMLQLKAAMAKIGLDEAKAQELLANVQEIKGKLVLDAKDQDHQQMLDRLTAVEKAIAAVQSLRGQPAQQQAPQNRGKRRRR